MATRKLKPIEERDPYAAAVLAEYDARASAADIGGCAMFPEGIVEQLRAIATGDTVGRSFMRKAADEIERLRALQCHDDATITKLKAKLREGEAQDSLRDRFAMAAMQGYLAQACGVAGNLYADDTARLAYAFADAMVRVRSEG